jgi:uncharacterized membrane protein
MKWTTAVTNGLELLGLLLLLAAVGVASYHRFGPVGALAFTGLCAIAAAGLVAAFDKHRGPEA